MADELRGRTIAILATDGVEQVELDMEFAQEGGEGATPYEVLLHAAMLPGTEHAAAVLSSLCVALRAGGVLLLGLRHRRDQVREDHIHHPGHELAEQHRP